MKNGLLHFLNVTSLAPMLRKPPEAQLAGQTPPALARGLRALLRKVGMHPEDTEEFRKT